MTTIDTDPRPELDVHWGEPGYNEAYARWSEQFAAWSAREARRRHNFDAYDAQLQGRNRERRKVANNTYLERRGPDTIAVRLHATDVVTYHRDGRIVFDAGGWYTVTTKDRMSHFSPCSLWAERGRWFIAVGSPGWDERGAERRRVAYADGITLLPDDTFTGAPSDDERLREDRDVARLKRDIRAFVDSITAEQIVERFANTAGDCWYCSFRTDDGTVMDDIGDGPSRCLADHVEERYFHASLAYRAVEAAGYRDPDLIMSTIYAAAAQLGRVDSLLTRNLAKFLRKRLITGRQTR